MNLQFFIEKLGNSEEYKKFKKENKDAFLCSGFFVIDVENNGVESKASLDFFSPKTKKMFGFQLNNEIKPVQLEMFKDSSPVRLKLDSKLTFEDIQEIISKEMLEKGIKNKIQKIIFVFQNHENEDLVFCTVFISGLGILKVHLDSRGKVILFEKKSIFDFFKKPGAN